MTMRGNSFMTRGNHPIGRPVFPPMLLGYVPDAAQDARRRVFCFLRSATGCELKLTCALGDCRLATRTVVSPPGEPISPFLRRCTRLRESAPPADDLRSGGSPASWRGTSAALAQLRQGK